MARYYNETKQRKATPNELAKKIILDAIYTKISLNYESEFVEGLTDKEMEEVLRHLLKHEQAIIKRIGTTDEFYLK
jgi:hypothetical protein